jgi:hypothetical protein
MHKEFRGPYKEPLNIKKTNFYFNPKIAPPPIETLWCKNHQNPSDRKSHTWAPLSLICYFLTLLMLYRIQYVVFYPTSYDDI